MNPYYEANKKPASPLIETLGSGAVDEGRDPHRLQHGPHLDEQHDDERDEGEDAAGRAPEPADVCPQADQAMALHPPTAKKFPKISTDQADLVGYHWCMAMAREYPRHMHLYLHYFQDQVFSSNLY